MRVAWIGSLLFSLLIVAAAPAFAADEDKDKDASTAQDKDSKDAKKDEKKDEKPVPPEKTSVSHGSVDVGGRTVHYTATAGNVLIRDDKENKPNASVFYVAYTADGVKDYKRRPVTFFYNGGPGSSTLWLHMGSFAPERVQTASPEYIKPAPYPFGPNPET